MGATRNCRPRPWGMDEWVNTRQNDGRTITVVGGKKFGYSELYQILESSVVASHRKVKERRRRRRLNQSFRYQSLKALAVFPPFPPLVVVLLLVSVVLAAVLGFVFPAVVFLPLLPVSVVLAVVLGFVFPAVAFLPLLPVS